MITQNGLDQGVGLGSYLCGFDPAIRRCRHQIGQLLGRIICGSVRQVPGLSARAWNLISSPWRKILTSLVSPGPHLPANVACGKRVVRPIKDNMMIRMNRTLLPLGALKGFCRKRTKRWDFLLEEDLPRSPLGRPMNLHPDLFLGPPQRPLVGLVDVPECPACQKLLPYNRHTPFHFPLVTGRSQTGWVDHEPVMPLQLTISPVQGRIVKIRLQNPTAKIIDYHGSRNSSKIFEGPPVTVDPRRLS